MANVKISDLTAYTDPVATDVLPIVDLVNDQTKKVKVEDLLKKFGAGTEALPSFAFTGDPDTGIYSPGANQFAVSTGGTQRLLIDASGNTTIQGDLTVNGTTTTIESTTLSIEDKNIELGTVSTPSDTTADGGGITLKGATDKTLTWVNSTDCWTFNQSLDLPAGSASAPALILNGDVNSGLFQSAADEISVATGGTQRVVVNSSGKVGINRAAPDNRLSIGSTGSFDEDSNSFYVGSNFTGTGTNFISSNKHAQRLFFNNASSNGYLAYANTGSAGTAGNAIAWQERFRIDSSGRLLVGTTNAVAFGSRQVLAVANGTTGGVISLYNSTTATANPRISSNPTGSEINDIGIHAASTNGSIIAYTNNDTERLRIAADGTVGIGCVPNSFQSGFDAVQIGGNLVLNVDSTGAGAGVYMSNNVYRDSGNSRWEYINTDEASQYYQAHGEHVWRYAASGSANAAITWSEAMRIDSSGRVGIGTTSPGQLLEINGASSPAVLIKDTTNNVIAYTFADDSVANFGSASAHPVVFRVNNTERVRIDSSGNVGVGTTSNGSSAKFEVKSTTGSISSATSRINGGITTTGAINTGASLLFAGHDGSNERDFASLFAGKENGTSGNRAAYLAFGTRPDGGSLTERMRIDSTGTLGIGTAGLTLQNNDGNYRGLQLGLGAFAFGRTNDTPLYLTSNLHRASSGWAYTQSTTASLIAMGTNIVFSNAPSGTAGASVTPTERARLDSSGNVGLGTSSPDFSSFGSNVGGIHIKEVGSSTSGVKLEQGTNRLHLMSSSTKNFIHGSTAHPLGISTNGTERLSITSSGDVGIGESSPSEKLHVKGGTVCKLTLESTSSTGTSGVQFGDPEDDNVGRIQYEHNGNYMQFEVNAAERLRIDSSGHITPGANGTQDLGSTSKRFANLYTSDLDLSNEAKGGNDVDGTWGAYTIQEGEEDLFLINKRSGKKYKFMLQEVS